MVPFAHAYRARRVLVTGHTGFKGAWLCLWLRRLGAQVGGLALPPEPEQPSMFVALGLEQLISRDHHLIDVRDAAAVTAAVAKFAPEIVFHLAAQSLVRRAYADPVATWAVNVMGTAHLLEALRGCASVRAVVVVTSDKCYANREWPWGYREIDPLGGDDPYSASKAAAELVTAAWRRSFFPSGRSPRVATARAGNVIGGGDFAVDRLIPDLVRAAGSSEPVVLRNPRAVRPWQHVLEPLAGYLALGARLLADDGDALADAWNFGPDPSDVVEVTELARLAVRVWGEGAPELRCGAAGPQPHEAGMLRLDVAKAAAQLGWRPKLDLDAAVRLTVEWYQAWLAFNGRHGAPTGMRALTERQIDDYAVRLAPPVPAGAHESDGFRGEKEASRCG